MSFRLKEVISLLYLQFVKTGKYAARDDRQLQKPHDPGSGQQILVDQIMFPFMLAPMNERLPHNFYTTKSVDTDELRRINALLWKGS